MPHASGTGRGAVRRFWLSNAGGATKMECIDHSLPNYIMRILLFIVLFCILWSVAWPVALLVLIASPLLLLIAIPLGLFGILISAVFALMEAILMLPARLLGYRSRC